MGQAIKKAMQCQNNQGRNIGEKGQQVDNGGGGGLRLGGLGVRSSFEGIKERVKDTERTGITPIPLTPKTATTYT
jgi:hypothetical protein